MSLPVIIRLSVELLLLYVYPCGGEFACGGNGQDIFKPLGHNSLNIILGQSNIANRNFVDETLEFAAVSGY